jgi:peptide/nickel transport system substrate-binding protein
MELRAFEHFFLGQPRTDRIIIQFVADQNTMTALVLAGELDMTMGGIDTARAAELAPRVQAAGIGTFVFGPNSYSHWTFQYNNHPSAVRLRDGRVRRAMAHALDRVQLAVFATAGLSPPIDSWIPPNDPRYRAAERIITRYPYDPQRALALFAQAGWTPGSDRLLRNAAGEPLQCDIRGAESVGSLGAKNWNEVGIETTESAIPPHLARDTAWRATFPCVEASSRPLGLAKITHLHSTNAMSAENGWRGNNRSGWSMPELDQAIDRFLGSVREAERLQAERDMVRLVTAELPVIPLYLSVNGTFLAQGFVGWNGYKQGTLIDPSTSWNAHLWERS